MRIASSDTTASRSNAYTERIVLAAMPLPGCSYTLDSVEPLGVEEMSDVPWAFQRDVYRFDMHLTENCPGRMPLSRTISVLSNIGPGGHWSEVFLQIKQ